MDGPARQGGELEAWIVNSADSPLPDHRPTGRQGFDAPAFTEAALRDAMLIKISWLRSFLVVADQGGFGAATTKLHLSQSRVSAHIAALEAALGFTLFERRARPTALTLPGTLFRDHAKSVLQQLQAGIEAARSSTRPGYGHLVVGSYPSVSSAFLPAVLSGLVDDYPEISVELVEGTAATLEAALTSGAVDVAFRPRLPPMREATLRSKSLWREAIVAVTKADDPLAKLASITVGDLERRPLIGNPSGPEEDGGGFDLRHAAGEAAAMLNIAFLTDQPATLVALVRGAFGVGVMSKLALSTTSLDGLAIRPIDSPTAFREVAIFWSERRASPTLDAFMRAVDVAAPPEGVDWIE
jgi:LysR family carnitine catabolism transcriptional activator